MPPTLEPQWQPISQLRMISAVIDSGLADAQAHYASLLEARPKPYVLDDTLVTRSIRAHTEQRDFLWVFKKQLARWRIESKSDSDTVEISRLDDQLERWSQVLTNILTLAEGLRVGTIETALAKSDAELGIEASIHGVR